MGDPGTPRELLPITEQVLAWVAKQRERLAQWERRLDQDEAAGWDVALARDALQPRRDTIRRIELCALATREAAMFHDLYGDPHAAAPEVPE